MFCPLGPKAAEIKDFGEETKVLNHFYYGYYKK